MGRKYRRVGKKRLKRKKYREAGKTFKKYREESGHVGNDTQVETKLSGEGTRQETYNGRMRRKRKKCDEGMKQRRN